jgi:transcriptional regulator with XRE-family HTH domain
MGRLNGQNSNSEIFANLGRVRRRAGLSQMALAERLGMSVQSYQKYEYGKSLLSSERLMHIAEILDVPLTLFFSGELPPLHEEELPDDEREVLMLFRRLEGPQQQKAFRSLEELIDRQEQEEPTQ